MSCSCAVACACPQIRNKASLLSFNSRVSFVGVGFIKLERDLPYNVSVAWKPTLYDFDSKWPLPALLHASQGIACL